MATTIKFTKMQGTGNDYIYVNTLSSPLQDPIKAARKWSAYHTGIGADGLVLIGASEKADDFPVSGQPPANPPLLYHLRK